MTENIEQNYNKKIHDANNIWAVLHGHFQILEQKWDQMNPEQRNKKINQIENLSEEALNRFVQLGFDKEREEQTTKEFKQKVNDFITSKK